MLEFFKTDISIIIILIINVILLISVIISSARINKINRTSKEFMRKLGNGKNIVIWYAGRMEKFHAFVVW